MSAIDRGSRTTVWYGLTSLSVLVVLLTSSSVAQPTEAERPASVSSTEVEEAEPVPDTPTFLQRWVLQYDSRWQSRTDFEDAEGTLEVYEAQLHLTRRFRLAPGTGLTPLLGYQYTRYDFGDDQQLLPGVSDPWQHVHNIFATALLDFKISDQWSLVTLAGGGFSAEEAALEDGQYALLGLNAAWQPHKRLTFGLGVRVRLDPVESRTYPFYLINWEISERWRLTTISQRTRLSYDLTDAVSIGVYGGYQDRRFRLRDDGPIPEGLGQFDQIVAGIDAQWHLSKHMLLVTRVGGAFGASVRAKDKDGHRVGDEDLEPTPFVSLALQVNF